MTRTLGSDQDTAMEVVRSGQILMCFRGAIGSGSDKSCVREEREKGVEDESKVFGKMDLLSAELGKNARQQVEVSGARFWTGYV